LVTQAYKTAGVTILLTLLSCAYSFRGSLPDGLNSVQVEQFRSTVTEYGLEQDITAFVTESIVRDGRLSIDNDNPDMHITGSVSYFSRTAVTYTSGEEVQQYKLEIRVVVSMGNTASNEYIIRNETVSEWLLYDPSAESLGSARDRLVAQVSDAVVRRCLSGW